MVFTDHYKCTRSKVWAYFVASDDPNYDKQAACLFCNAILSCKGGSTKGLWDHLSRRHQITRLEVSSQVTPNYGCASYGSVPRS